MSYDLLLFKHRFDLEDDAAAIAPLGTRVEVIGRLRQLLPMLDFSDPTWGVLGGAGYSIEFNMGAAALTESIMLHLRGGGEPLAVVKCVCKATGWTALDMQTGSFLEDSAGSETGWQSFQQFRDQVLKEKNGTP